MAELTNTPPAPAQSAPSLKTLLTPALDERKRWLIAAVGLIGAWFYISDLKLLPGALCLLAAYLFLPAHAQRYLRVQARVLLVQIEARSEALLAEYRQTAQTAQTPTEPTPTRDWSEDDTLTEADAWPVAKAPLPQAPDDIWSDAWPVRPESERSNSPD